MEISHNSRQETYPRRSPDPSLRYHPDYSQTGLKGRCIDPLGPCGFLVGYGPNATILRAQVIYDYQRGREYYELVALEEPFCSSLIALVRTSAKIFLYFFCQPKAGCLYSGGPITGTTLRCSTGTFQSCLAVSTSALALHEGANRWFVVSCCAMDWSPIGL